MAVKIGHASSSETGKITGGKAGDQTGREVFTRNWYNHSKGWRVFRAKSPTVAEKIAKCMEMACANNKIGYDQNQRSTLYNAAKPYAFDVSKVTTAVETDCSALVRVCCAYAGVVMNDFNTVTEPGRLLASGAFVELTATKYTKDDDYLCRGDILCTKTKGHTMVILANGSKAGVVVVNKEYALGERTLANGMEGKDVKELQSYLIQLGYDLGKWGADGDFGDATEIAVRKFQKDHNITVDGKVGSKTLDILNDSFEDKVVKNVKEVEVVNGNCYVRTTSNTSGDILGVATRGSKLEYLGETSENGWHHVKFEGLNGWISGKYSNLIGD